MVKRTGELFRSQFPRLAVIAVLCQQYCRNRSYNEGSAVPVDDQVLPSVKLPPWES